MILTVFIVLSGIALYLMLAVAVAKWGARHYYIPDEEGLEQER